ARRQLLANLVHELGRPLGAIRSAIQALLKGATGDPLLAADLLNGLDGETARLQRLLDDLAGLHDQVLGRLELSRRPVELDAWLVEAAAPWEAAARARGLAWETHAPPGLPQAYIDPDRLGQALGNLLSNAIKFTPAGGRVALQAGAGAGQLEISVQDSGSGIPPDELHKVFQPFYRGAQGRRIVQGMGLWLSIARDIAAAHGGELTVDSTPGAGSRFTLRLPLA
ncbi:MAG: sensor histidine kinase, partial [Chloroflexota bacterium]